MPGMGMSASGPSPSPSFQGLAGGQPQGQPAPAAQGASPGGAQLGGAAVRMGLEIDQALKLLAQALPGIAPWVEKTVMELRQQMGTAMQAGAPTNPTPSGAQMPDGSHNL